MKRYSGNESDYDEEVIYDSSFDVTDGGAQLAMVGFCSTLERAPCDYSGCQGTGVLLLQDMTASGSNCVITSMYTTFM